LQNVPASPAATSTVAPESTPFGGKPKAKFERGNPSVTPPPTGATSSEPPQNRYKAKQLEATGTPSVGGAQSTESGQGMKHKTQETSVPSTNTPSGAAGAPVEHSQGKPQGGKGKKSENASPSPSP
jgi:hypothetical protein